MNAERCEHESSRTQHEKVPDVPIHREPRPIEALEVAMRVAITPFTAVPTTAAISNDPPTIPEASVSPIELPRVGRLNTTTSGVLNDLGLAEIRSRSRCPPRSCTHKLWVRLLPRVHGSGPGLYVAKQRGSVHLGLTIQDDISISAAYALMAFRVKS